MQTQLESKENTIYLYFRGVFVGVAENMRMDMWYMEGVWKPEAKAMTRHLEEDLRSRSFQEALNGMRGKLVKWSCQLTENPQDNGLAMCIYDARIVVRMIIYEETIKALRKDPSCL